jgi:tRNA(Arg) A34 adenosine deaminase TadA
MNGLLEVVVHVDVDVLEVVVHVDKDVVILEVVVHEDEDIVVLESEQARMGSEATAHASSVRAKLALGMAESSNTEGLDVRMCICARGGSPLI